MEQIKAPMGEEIELRQVMHESGVPLLRVLVRDGGRYTYLDLDPATANRWGRLMQVWARETVERMEAAQREE
ncbi:hypothetical protein M911_02900 [Ectothiorhodospira haloalkaliphila]|uniref:Uncharacterized protein n=1 Tax=Ectothiorhodospira haloalkaliphila TaxID=421628 RepID=W8KEV6_9GAMM|nr:MULTISPECIES: hypothetical protein [Ectothiorhodospira]AHK78294.1 hypothetical protein M911_02900 [Ectothiorhodospira haloalkaliphila]MCG5493358.1 hypothetical protein [Ectothiorhodospira variabilis]MCG5496704.1 hypothetical protein [Ectothiorhodospira variabilis]MCG5502687.1 hypothetical protein [Ectothiorhodospira variabilis]MCG5505547.1 hypothetical protein [Ectothiorhodospira variabilis]